MPAYIISIQSDVIKYNGIPLSGMYIYPNDTRGPAVFRLIFGDQYESILYLSSSDNIAKLKQTLAGNIQWEEIVRTKLTSRKDKKLYICSYDIASFDPNNISIRTRQLSHGSPMYPQGMDTLIDAMPTSGGVVQALTSTEPETPNTPIAREVAPPLAREVTSPLQSPEATRSRRIGHPVDDYERLPHSRTAIPRSPRSGP